MLYSSIYLRRWKFKSQKIMLKSHAERCNGFKLHIVFRATLISKNMWMSSMTFSRCRGYQALSSKPSNQRGGDTAENAFGIQSGHFQLPHFRSANTWARNKASMESRLSTGRVWVASCWFRCNGFLQVQHAAGRLRIRVGLTTPTATCIRTKRDPPREVLRTSQQLVVTPSAAVNFDDSHGSRWALLPVCSEKKDCWQGGAARRVVLGLL